MRELEYANSILYGIPAKHVGDITLDPPRQCQRASKTISPFIVFAAFCV